MHALAKGAARASGLGIRDRMRPGVRRAGWGFLHGVWKKAGKSKYKLNHFAWVGGSDTTNAPSGIGNPQGPTRIVEAVTLSPDGNHYVGTFTLDATDTSGNPTAHIIGVMAATRVTVETTIPELL